MTDLSVWWGRFVIVTIFVCSMVGLYFNHDSPYMIFTIIVITALFLATFTCSVGAPLLLMRAAAVQRAAQNRHNQVESSVWTVESGPPRYEAVVSGPIVPPTPPPPYHFVVDMPPPYKLKPDEEDKPAPSYNTCHV